MTPVHGSPEGYDLGCTKDTTCPAFEITGMSCETAHIRFVTGERRYMQLRGRGLDPKQIAARLGFTPEKSRERVEAEKVRREEKNVVEQETVVVMSNRATGRLPDGVTRADVRAWAQANGIECNDRGSLPKAVLEAHKAAHPALWGVIVAKPKRQVKKMNPAVQLPALSEPVEHDLAAVKTATESASSDVGVLSLVQLQTVATAIVHAPVVPDMETRAELFNEGFADAVAQYGPVFDDLARTEGALEMVLTKWAGEQQRRKDAERLAFALAQQVTELEARLAATSTHTFAFVQSGSLVRYDGSAAVIEGNRFDGGRTVLHGAHVAARKPWWRRWAA